MTEKKKYWFEDVRGKHHIFEATDEKEAYHYFKMEGDHAWDYGLADKEYFVNRLRGDYDA